MAVDEALLDSVCAGQSSPVLRLYSWEPACVSIGCAQSLDEEVDTTRCLDLGVHWVRRLTGGRLIVHDCEVTYCVVARVDDPIVGGGILETYQSISEGIAAGLRALGVNAEMTDPRSSEAARARGARSGICFDTAAAHELTVSGRKLVGSAQARRKAAFLQHGSILIDIDAGLHHQVARSAARLPLGEFTRSLSSGVTCLRELVGELPAWDDLSHIFASGFAERLGVELTRDSLSPVEWDMSDKLRAKYLNSEWNARR